MNQKKNSIDKSRENLTPIEAKEWKEKEQAWAQWKKRRVQDKKCYAISSTALISTLAINRLIKWREEGGAEDLSTPPIIPRFIYFFLQWSLTRYQDRCVHDKAVQLVSFGKCSSFFPTRKLVHRWIRSRICHALASRMESSIWKERRY